MKINKYQQTLTTPGISPDKTAVKGIQFNDILESRLQALTDSSKTTPSNKMQPLNHVPPMLRFDSLATTESALSHLDEYSQALADLNFNTEALEPHVSLLEQDTSAMIDLRSNFSKDDPLGLLLDRVSTVTFLESFKFRRGDFNS